MSDGRHLLPTVGLVGEIFLKLNSYANRSAAQWLMEQGVGVAPHGAAKKITDVGVKPPRVY